MSIGRSTDDFGSIFTFCVDPVGYQEQVLQPQTPNLAPYFSAAAPSGSSRWHRLMQTCGRGCSIGIDLQWPGSSFGPLL